MAENTPLRMIRNHVDGLPSIKLPTGYSLRNYQPGDENHWIEIHYQADKFNKVDANTFELAFGATTEQLEIRQFYLLNSRKEVIGTATAWFNNYLNFDYGRIHWVAIIPEEQGKGLANPLLAVACQRLVELGHQQLYLDTSAARITAINLYLKFGFQPEIKNVDDLCSWKTVEKQLKKPLDLPEGC